MYRFMIEEIKAELERKLDEGISVEHMSVVKNNGMKREGFSIRFPGEKMCPTVYVEEQLDLVRKGIMTTEDVADSIIEFIEVQEANDSMRKAVQNIDKKMVLKNVIYQLVNREMNESELDNLPHKEFMDLMAIYRVMIMEDGSFVVTSKQLKVLDISIEELDKAAMENTQNVGFDVKDMRAVMAETFGFDDEPADLHSNEKMYVMSNKTRWSGAAIMLYSKYFKELAEKVDDDLFVLPSSIHEVLAIPGRFVEAVESLKEMVKDVNDTQVAEDEILSYNVYKYSRETGELCIA